MSGQYDYDVIIIGAGVGGLVCGCYLAKAGMQTLIVEKNRTPGGYCTSFTKGGFHFDACAHSIGSLRHGGNVDTVLRELEIDKRIDFVRHNPSDIIFSADYKISFWNEMNRTIREFQQNFQRESGNVEAFFHFINNCQGLSFVPLRRISFRDLLDQYFEDERLKAVLSLPILGNTGWSVSKVSAFTAVTVYKEFMLDGGYYPEGGIQEFPDLLLQRFTELGGNIIAQATVKSIKVRSGKVEGVVLKNDDFISAGYVVSNADARQTFMNMLDGDLIDREVREQLQSMTPTLSMFILYLGIDSDFDELPRESASLWYLPHYNIEDMFDSAVRGEVDNLDWFLLKISDDRKSILRFVNCPFKDNHFWKENKTSLIDKYIKKTEQLVPNLSGHIIYKDAASPGTLSRWTLNYQGASYGWAGVPDQIAVQGLSGKTSVRNLYLAGHWATLFQGVPGVVFLGRTRAKTILQNWGQT